AVMVANRSTRKARGGALSRSRGETEPALGTVVPSVPTDAEQITAHRARVMPDNGVRPGSARAVRQMKRREDILDAALEEFSTRGFAATRLDDVARRAGVAKGTIYLYFRDKESLFQELVRAMLGPLVERLESAPMLDLPARFIAE